MIYEITWTNLHRTTVEASSLKEAKEMAMELDSTTETYQECIHQEIEERR